MTFLMIPEKYTHSIGAGRIEEEVAESKQAERKPAARSPELSVQIAQLRGEVATLGQRLEDVTNFVAESQSELAQRLSNLESSSKEGK